MKNSSKFKLAASIFSMLLFVLTTSCKKDAVVTPTPSTVTITTTSTDVTTLADVQTLSCQLPDTISVTNAPAALSSYLTANYGTYTNQFVYKIKANGTITGYLANLVSGNSHMNIRFDTTGAFIKALPVPAHTGFAMFGTDTIATSALPTALITYLAANVGYTVQRRFMESDSSFTIIATQGTNAYSLSYSNATPTALSVINLGAIDFTTPNPDISTLPSSVASYINTNDNGATIERIYSETCTGASNGYTVIFKNNGTQYAAEFDPTGAFTTILQER